MILCPACENDLDIEEEDLDEGEVVSCLECGADFEVVSLGPLELTRVVEEDDEDAEVEKEESDY